MPGVAASSHLVGSRLSAVKQLEIPIIISRSNHVRHLLPLLADDFVCRVRKSCLLLVYELEEV